LRFVSVLRRGVDQLDIFLERRLDLAARNGVLFWPASSSCGIDLARAEAFEARALLQQRAHPARHAKRLGVALAQSRSDEVWQLDSSQLILNFGGGVAIVRVVLEALLLEQLEEELLSQVGVYLNLRCDGGSVGGEPERSDGRMT